MADRAIKALAGIFGDVLIIQAAPIHKTKNNVPFSLKKKSDSNEYMKALCSDSTAD